MLGPNTKLNIYFAVYEFSVRVLPYSCIKY